MAASTTLRGTTLRGRTRILAAPGDSFSPAVLQLTTTRLLRVAISASATLAAAATNQQYSLSRTGFSAAPAFSFDPALFTPGELIVATTVAPAARSPFKYPYGPSGINAPWTVAGHVDGSVNSLTVAGRIMPSDATLEFGEAGCFAHQTINASGAAPCPILYIIRGASHFTFNSVGTGWQSSSDNGVTWADLVTNPFTTGTGSLFGIDNGTRAVVLSYGTNKVFTSTDGNTWVAGTMPIVGSWSRLVWDGSYFVVTENTLQPTRTYRSQNGTTWTAGGTIANSNFATYSHLDASSTTTGKIYAFQDADIAISTDSGATWTQTRDGVVSGSLPTGGIQPLRHVNGYLIVPYGTGGICYSTDDGATWTTSLTPDPLDGTGSNGFMDLIYVASKNTWLGITYYGILYTATSIDGPWTETARFTTGNTRRFCVPPGTSFICFDGYTYDGTTSTYLLICNNRISLGREQDISAAYLGWRHLAFTYVTYSNPHTTLFGNVQTASGTGLAPTASAVVPNFSLRRPYSFAAVAHAGGDTVMPSTSNVGETPQEILVTKSDPQVAVYDTNGPVA